MIRPDLFKAVLEALEKHPFLAREDFVVSEYQNKEGEPCLQVLYRYDDQILFKFHIPQKKTPRSRDEGYVAYRFSATFRPGKEAVEESQAIEERSGLVSELQAWVARVYDDTVAAPLVRQLQQHSKSIDDLTERLNDLPDEPLSQEDVAAFTEGLEKLRAELTEELRDQENEKKALGVKVAELAKDIEFLKQTLTSMSRRRWGELFTARVQKWKARLNLRQLSAGARVAKLLLPGAAGPAVEVVAQVLDGVAEIREATTPSEDATSSGNGEPPTA